MVNNAVRLIAPVLLGAFILLFPADGLRALGLGEARVDSWLGQPLDVSIRLLEVESDAVESVSVGPASLEDYERLGVPSDSLGLGLQVSIDRSTNPATVRVRSQRPVDDPIVQILIDARWSSGRVLREYTLFLDPPVMDSAPPAREVTQPAAETQREMEPEAAPAEREPQQSATGPGRESSRPAEESTPAPTADAADSLRVAPGDTLWGITEDWRPDRSLSMDQVMLAIFNRNRDAFLGENINRLRSDARLDMPGLDEIRNVSRSEAERRVREHMRAWEPGAGDDVPVVSDAATPETAEEPSASTEVADASAADESTGAEESTGASPGEEDYRLDVVPPEEDQYSEGSAVAEGEIQQVSDRLADVEEEIAGSEVEEGRFDQHVAEIREALEQRDMAGLAVAEESLAELETRLREAREARAEQERLAQSGDGEAATDSEEGDEIADYMSELEEEFGTEEEAASDGGEMAESGDDAGGQMAEGDDDASTLAEEESQSASAGDEQLAEEAGSADESMPVTQTSGGWRGWLWPAIGVLAVVLIGAAAMLWIRRRGAGESGEETFVGGDALESTRAAVARNPGDLGAHLSLLNVLADQGREQEFTDAFDQMYQEVEDESAPEWQEALSLASAHVPDHPLLTPREDEHDDADFDRRADEMLGMLEMEDESEPDTTGGESQPEEDSELGGFDEAKEPESARSEADSERGAAEEETFDEDMDLAVLSERLDDPAAGKSPLASGVEDTSETDFGEFEEGDEQIGRDVSDETVDETSEASVDLEDEESEGPDLDFAPAQEQEADEVLGEAGAREDEDLDLEFSSDADESESTAVDEGLDFDLGEDESPEPGSDDIAAEDSGAKETAEVSESTESEGTEAPESSGGSLSDEDADVKLDLARAYISVDLADSARPVLEEVISDGSAEKQAEAKKLLDDLG